MREKGKTVHAHGSNHEHSHDVSVRQLQSLLAEANQRLNYGWLCCVIDRTGWLPLDHWYPERPHAPDTPHPVALSRDPADLIVGLKRYIESFRRPTSAAPLPNAEQERPVSNTQPHSRQETKHDAPSASPRNASLCSAWAPRLPPRVRKKRLNDRTGPLRCPGHLAFVRRHACCVAGPDCSGPIEAAHIRDGSGAGMGQKPDDGCTISLCRWHHQQQHAVGEARFEQMYSIDLQSFAQTFARRSPCWQRLMAKQQAKCPPQ